MGTYRTYGPDDGPDWESFQHHEDDYWWRQDMIAQNSGACPPGHRDNVVPTPWGAPGIQEGLGDWWCEEHEVQFGKRQRGDE